MEEKVRSMCKQLEIDMIQKITKLGVDNSPSSKITTTVKNPKKEV